MADFVRYPDARLAQVATQRPVDDALCAVGQRMLEAQRRARSYGLAASHIGEIEPVIVINLGDGATRRDELWFNPQILSVAPETAMGVEGSVSLPGVEAQLPRPVWATFAYDDWDGQRHEVQLENFHARVAMHEIEQMQGRFFLDGLSRLKRERLLKKATKHRPT